LRVRESSPRASDDDVVFPTAYLAFDCVGHI
jgi:hypothetical protein